MSKFMPDIYRNMPIVLAAYKAYWYGFRFRWSNKLGRTIVIPIQSKETQSNAGRGKMRRRYHSGPTEAA